MKLFCFSSKNVENIRRGVRAKRWAVATVSRSAMAGRVTKARRYFDIGDKGVLYCSPTQSFTTPFIVESKADPNEVVKDIWPEPWVLPFSMTPLGDPSRQIHVHDAKGRWPILREQESFYGGVHAALNGTGTTAFVPTDISDEDWQCILNDLAFPESGTSHVP